MALVSSKLKLIYLHIPKTGGSSVTEALRPYWDRKPDAGGYDTTKKGWQPKYHSLGPMHVRWEQIKEEGERLLANGYRVAAGLRSPWARFRSIYEIQHEGMSISDFIKSPPARAARNLHPCMWWMPPIEPGNLHFLLEFDELEGDFRAMCEALGIEATLPHLNPHNTPRRDANPAPEPVVFEGELLNYMRCQFAPDIIWYPEPPC